MNHDELIDKLNLPLAGVISSLDQGYYFSAEEEDDQYVYLTFETDDAPRIVVQIEKKYNWQCRTCTRQFNEPDWDCDGNSCPTCGSKELIDLKQEAPL